MTSLSESDETYFYPDESTNDSKLLKIIEEMKNPDLIEEINLEELEDLTDKSVIPLLSKCKNVKKVNFSLTQITDKSLLYLFKNCPYVTDLSTCYCEKLTDKSLSHIPYKNLTELAISGTNVKFPTFSNIRNICEQLVYLAISDITEITTDILEDILINNPNLVCLFISGCQSLSDEIIPIIIKNCKNLKRISIYDCPNFYDNGWLIKDKIPSIIFE